MNVLEGGGKGEKWKQRVTNGETCRSSNTAVAVAATYHIKKFSVLLFKSVKFIARMSDWEL